MQDTHQEGAVSEAEEVGVLIRTVRVAVGVPQNTVPVLVTMEGKRPGGLEQDVATQEHKDAGHDQFKSPFDVGGNGQLE